MTPPTQMDVDTTVERLSGDSLETAFNSLLKQRPDALVSAVNAEGIFVPLPASLKIDRGRVLHARSALDFVVAEDRNTVIEGWFRVKEQRGTRITVRLAVAPDQPTPMHFFDLTEVHGTYFCVVVIPDGVDGSLRPDEVEGFTSRITWTKKTETAEFIEADPGLEKILGWTSADLLGKRSLDFMHPEDEELSIDNWMAMLASGRDGQRVRLRHLHKNGEYIWVEIANKYLLDDPDQPHILAQMIDISEEMAAHEALREREQLLNRLAEALPSGLLHVRADSQVVYTNERLHQIVGVPPTDTLANQLQTVLREDWPLVEEAFKAAMGGTDADLEVRLQLPGLSSLRLCHLSMRSLSEADGTINAAIVSVSDVTESAALREELRERATYDSLTRCHNRSSTMQLLNDALADERQDVGVLFIDLDRFKVINDELGHAAGDELLALVADRLRSVVRPGDIVGRVGGDEFLVVCPGIAGQDETIEIADRVAATMRREMSLGIGPIDMRGSVGVAWSSPEVKSADELVARADAAMYESKRRGVGRPVIFTPELWPTGTVRLDDERALHNALEQGELSVHFQPVVALASGDFVGFESLVRWSRDDEGLVASEFIDMAEVTGLIHELGTYVRADLVRNVVANLNRSDPAHVWFFNVSMPELQMPGVAVSILAAIDESGLPRSSFVAEFKGNLTAEDLHLAAGTIRELQAAGVGIGIDDFGAGGTSLDVLRMIPLDWVKLAPEFTAEVTTDAAAAGIVEAMLKLAQTLQIRAVVKGIETDSQHEVLSKLGAEFGQGHLFAAAAPLSDLFT